MGVDEVSGRGRVVFFDTTLRDGEQAPGCSMNLEEKLGVASRLERLGVDVIEAGFAAASPGDAMAVKAVSRAMEKTIVASLARASREDIDAAWEAIREARRPRIHTFIATSEIHMRHKLRMSPEQVLEKAVEAVRYARSLCPDVEFSAEDASRSDPDFLCRVYRAVIEAGAGTINIPDTVGYSIPEEFAALVRRIKSAAEGVGRVIVSVHCHNDLGLAVANSLAAIEAGAGQVECTMNGIGERAGNAALEEVAMALRTRAGHFGVDCGIDTTQIYATSRLVSISTGSRVQANKAIVGENAFAHEAGIHQHGVLANRETYEIMTPESIGLPKSRLVLGKHSGRHAFDERLRELGLSLDPQDAARVFEDFKRLADKKKTVGDPDIEALVRGSISRTEERFRLERFIINAGSSITATSAVRLRLEDGSSEECVAAGDGPIDASFKAIDKAVGRHFVLNDFSLEAVTGGKDAQGEASVRITCDGKRYNGRGLSTDVIEASIKAYLVAINAASGEGSLARAREAV